MSQNFSSNFSSQNRFRTRGTSNGNHGRQLWIKARKCHCELSNYFDIKVSGSRSNPGRLYYKCSGCGEFDWVNEDAMMNNDVAEAGEGNHTADLRAEIAGMKAALDSLATTGSFVVKMAVVMYLVLVICVILK